MKQNNNLAWFIVVICVICWSLYEIYPPTSGDLLAAFSSRAENKDATFSGIVTEAEALQKTGTNSEFSALLKAAGTNELQKYFPYYPAAAQLKPNLYVL